MNKLTQIVIDKVMGEGAIDAGIITSDTLAGGPPSVELSHCAVFYTIFYSFCNFVKNKI